ncbi:MAG: ROK family glucokinase [Clostridiales bacterium]|nr:ROK family glucokinase [Candidatus Blautia equi]
MSLYCFGIDVGGTTVKCGLFQTDGTLLDKWEIPTRKENNGEEILPDIAKAIEAKIAEKNIQKSDVAGVGIGIPGPINEDGECAVAVNLGWGFKAVAKEMETLTGLPAKAGNDANVAALGEAWAGAAKGCRNSIMLTLGTGVGGGIIINNKILAGSHGAGGEIGHANVNHNETDKCNCGNSGCLEQYTSATGIVRVAKKELAACEEPSSLRAFGESLTCKDVLDAYAQRDPMAVLIMNKVCDVLGGAIATFTAVLDPDVVVIGGGVSKAGSILTDCISQYYKKYAFTVCKATPIVLATLGNDAGIYGSARMVLD